jgi:hypothetical protein
MCSTRSAVSRAPTVHAESARRAGSVRPSAAVNVRIPMRLALLALSLAACASAPSQLPATAGTPGPTVTTKPANVVAGPSSRIVELERDCRAGDTWSCAVASVYYHGGSTEDGIAMDWSKAVALAEPGCAAKVPEACAILILILESGGQGVPRDAARASDLVHRMSDHGVRDIALGVLPSDGTRVLPRCDR